MILIVGLLIGGAADHGPSTPSASGVLPPVTVPAPPSASSAEVPCTKVLQALPQSLTGLAPRIVHSDPGSPFVVGWGDPAIVLRCGVDRPATLRPGDSELLFAVNGVYFSKSAAGTDSVFTAIDRAAYIEITVPEKYGGGPLSPLAGAVAKALPAVCVGGQSPGVPQHRLCVYRK